jgi:hypothetical protein
MQTATIDFEPFNALSDRDAQTRIAAARAKKHVALQKPMTIDLKKARRMIEAMKASASAVATLVASAAGPSNVMRWESHTQRRTRVLRSGTPSARSGTTPPVLTVVSSVGTVDAHGPRLDR